MPYTVTNLQVIRSVEDAAHFIARLPQLSPAVTILIPEDVGTEIQHPEWNGGKPARCHSALGYAISDELKKIGAEHGDFIDPDDTDTPEWVYWDWTGGGPNGKGHYRFYKFLGVDTSDVDLPESAPARLGALLEHYTFATTCVHADEADLNDMWEAGAEEISYEEFRNAVGQEMVDKLNGQFGVDIDKDWHVTFHKGIYRGRPCVVLTHSAINHIWTR